MDMKEKLVELLEETGMVDNKNRCNIIAEELISHGVTVQGATDNNVGCKWISVKDRLPTMDSIVEKDFVLVCTENNEHLIVAVADVWRFRDFITHWMPLPELPKGE